MSKHYIPVITIAGSDSSGGAGAQADIKTISALGCYAASAITAITVQNTRGVTAVHTVPADIVEGQIRAVMDDIRPTVAKVGMVNDTATIRAIARALADYADRMKAIIIDPVMVATSGSPLMQPDAIGAFRTELMPLATLLTPNVPEAEILSGEKLGATASEDDFQKAAGKIALQCASAVLIKGGHHEGRLKVDRLYDSEGTMTGLYSSPTVDTRNTHGTGCTLSSAIASYMARGLAVTDAIQEAKKWLSEALKAGADVEIGDGHGPVDHFFMPSPMIITGPDNAE